MSQGCYPPKALVLVNIVVGVVRQGPGAERPEGNVNIECCLSMSLLVVIVMFLLNY